MCYSNILKILGFCKYPVIVYLMAQCGYDLMIVYFDCTCYIFGLFSIKDELWSNLLLFSIFFFQVEIRFTFPDTLACQS